jgi:hypothetical protein
MFSLVEADMLKCKMDQELKKVKIKIINDSIENILKTLSTTCMLYEPDITYAEEDEVKKCKIIS